MADKFDINKLDILAPRTRTKIEKTLIYDN